MRCQIGSELKYQERGHTGDGNLAAISIYMAFKASGLDDDAVGGASKELEAKPLGTLICRD